MKYIFLKHFLLCTDIYQTRHNHTRHQSITEGEQINSAERLRGGGGESTNTFTRGLS